MIIGHNSWEQSLLIFFKSRKTKRITSAPYHAVANGQAELTNEVIVNNIKKQLEEQKGRWLEMLPGIMDL